MGLKESIHWYKITYKILRFYLCLIFFLVKGLWIPNVNALQWLPLILKRWVQKKAGNPFVGIACTFYTFYHHWKPPTRPAAAVVLPDGGPNPASTRMSLVWDCGSIEQTGDWGILNGLFVEVAFQNHFVQVASWNKLHWGHILIKPPPNLLTPYLCRNLMR